MKNTKIISAYPACGKSHYTNNNASCLDSDSSLFSWITEDGQKKRNPEFPANYIAHIRENIGKVDYIFVSSHLSVRQALEDAGIDYVTVYPDLSLKAEWLERMRKRGNDEAFISFQDENFEKFVESIIEEPHGRNVYYLSAGQYIDSVIDELTKEEESLFEAMMSDLSTVLNTLHNKDVDLGDELEMLQMDLFESRTPYELGLTMEEVFDNVLLLTKQISQKPTDAFCKAAANRLWETSKDFNLVYRIYENIINAYRQSSLDALFKIPELKNFMFSLGM